MGMLGNLTKDDHIFTMKKKKIQSRVQTKEETKTKHKIK